MFEALVLVTAPMRTVRSTVPGNAPVVKVREGPVGQVINVNVVLRTMSCPLTVQASIVWFTGVTHVGTAAPVHARRPPAAPPVVHVGTAAPLAESTWPAPPAAVTPTGLVPFP